MRKLALKLLLVFAIGSPVAVQAAEPTGRAIASHALKSKHPGSQVAFGAYDPHAAFSSERDVDIEHVFVFWQQLDLKDFRKRLRYAEQRQRTMMVTVEPYTKARNWRDGGEHLFADILDGKFDKEIRTVCTELGRFDGQVLIRWGHEMEDPTGRYPWARKDAEGFKSAFRQFVRECRRLVPAASFVWSPKGEKNLADYYPGAEHVDVVGVSLWGLEKMDVTYYGGHRGFVETFDEKYRRVAQFGKPVIIAELGVSGSRTYRDHWFSSLAKTIKSSGRFGQLRAVVYFNDKEPHYWPLGLGSPDWRIRAARYAAGWF